MLNQKQREPWAGREMPARCDVNCCSNHAGRKSWIFFGAHDRASAASLDHLVGAGEQRLGDGQAKHLRSFEIDDQLKFGRRLHQDHLRRDARERRAPEAGGHKWARADVNRRNRDETRGEAGRKRSAGKFTA